MLLDRKRLENLDDISLTNKIKERTLRDNAIYPSIITNRQHAFCNICCFDCLLRRNGAWTVETECEQ